MKWSRWTLLLFGLAGFVQAEGFFEAVGQSAIFDLMAGSTTGSTTISAPDHSPKSISIVKQGRRKFQISPAEFHSHTGIASIALTDLLGCHRSTLNPQNDGTFQIGRHLPGGMYLVRVSLKDGSRQVASLFLF